MSSGRGLRPPIYGLRQGPDSFGLRGVACGQRARRLEGGPVAGRGAPTARSVVSGHQALPGRGLRPPFTSLRQGTDSFGARGATCGLPRWRSGIGVPVAWRGVVCGHRLSGWCGVGLRPPVASLRQGTDSFGARGAACGQPGWRSGVGDWVGCRLWTPGFRVFLGRPRVVGVWQGSDSFGACGAGCGQPRRRSGVGVPVAWRGVVCGHRPSGWRGVGLRPPVSSLRQGADSFGWSAWGLWTTGAAGGDRAGRSA
jgi:hypothetical protein